MTKILNWIKSQNKNTKNILYIVLAIVSIFLASKVVTNNNLIFVKTNSNKKITIEVYDTCIDSLTYEDSCEIVSTLLDIEFKPKKINFVAVHCTGGPYPKKETTKSDWEYFFYNERYPGTHMVGYNYIVDINKVISLRPIDKSKFIEKNELVWGVAGFNSQTVSIAYIGGLEKKDGKWVNKDTRTARQKFLIDSLVCEMTKIVPGVKIQGHKDFPKVHKTCPNYEI